MIVADQQERSAVPVRTGQVGVPDGVHGTIQPRRLAVPDREHPIDPSPRKQPDLLRTPGGGGRDVLVDPRLEMDVEGPQLLFGLPQLHVVATERRTAVPGDETAGVEARGDIAPALLEGQPNERLHAGQIDPALLEDQAIGKRHVEPFLVAPGGQLSSSLIRSFGLRRAEKPCRRARIVR